MSASGESDKTVLDGREPECGAIANLTARISSLRAEWHSSLHPQTAAEARLVSGQLTVISNASRYHGILLPIIGLAIALNFAATVPWTLAFGWWLPVAVFFGGAALVGRYRPPPEPGLNPGDAAKAAKSFTVMTVLLTLIWCAMMPILWVPGDNFNHVLLVLIIASSMASSSSVNAPHFASGMLCMLVYGLTLTVTPLVVEGGGNIFFVMMAVAFWISMTAQIQSNYEMTKRMLSLQDERTELIDDLKRAKAESDAARERAEQASHAKSQFLANMSHELRTPLNAILGFSEMIHTDIGIDQPGKHKEYAKLVYDSGYHLLALINDVLDLAKIEAGSLELSETDVQLEEIIAETAHLLHGKALKAGVSVSSDVSGPLPALRADQRALKQVLINLLSNALKYTPPGGDIVAFAYVQPTGEPVFGVRDTGVGIAEEDLPRVFEKFGQGRHDVVTMEKGTGLGLAIVKGLVSAHGGEVTLVSSIGEGTSVTVMLPAHRRISESAERAAS